jgi:hypothetical protein
MGRVQSMEIFPSLSSRDAFLGLSPTNAPSSPISTDSHTTANDTGRGRTASFSSDGTGPSPGGSCGGGGGANRPRTTSESRVADLAKLSAGERTARARAERRTMAHSVREAAVAHAYAEITREIGKLVVEVWDTKP